MVLGGGGVLRLRQCPPRGAGCGRSRGGALCAMRAVAVGRGRVSGWLLAAGGWCARER